MRGLGLFLSFFRRALPPSGPVPPGSSTYFRPDGTSYFLRPSDPADTYLRP